MKTGPPSAARQSNLFEYAATPLGIRRSPTLADRLHTNLRRCSHPLLVIAKTRNEVYIPKPFPHQLFFSFAPPVSLPAPARPTVVRFPPRRHSAYLDYGVYDYFRNVPGAAEPARKLEENRIIVLGLLVQMSEDMVRAVTSIDDDTLERMKAVLAEIGFGFDMRVPWWNRGYRALYQYGHPPSLI